MNTSKKLTLESISNGEFISLCESLAKVEWHNLAKLSAAYWLERQGFVDEQIHLEMAILVKLGKSYNSCWRIDVVGIKEGCKVAIECGQCSKYRLEKLKEYFSEVYHLDWDGKLKRI